MSYLMKRTCTGYVGQIAYGFRTVSFKQTRDSGFKFYGNVHMLHLLRVDGVQNSPKNFDLNHVTLTYDLELCDLDPRDLDLGPPFLKLG